MKRRQRKPNLQTVRDFLSVEIARLTGKPCRSDTVLEYQDALETLSAFEQTAEGKAFDAEDFHKSDARWLYDLFRVEARKIL